MESHSLLALRQVIDWAYEQGMSIRDRLSEAELTELQRVFSDQRAWSFELYEPLRALAHALPRMDLPDLPVPIDFGDCLAALDAVLHRDAASGAAEGAYGAGLARYTWSLDHHLSSDAFETLGYAKISAGISALRAKHRSGWQQHAEHNKAFLLRGAPSSEGGTAAIIGAGKLYDIPLKLLAERFERVLLIDVDGAALAESAEQVLGSSKLRDRVELVTSDVTGINFSFVSRAEAIFAERLDAEQTGQALLALLYSFRSAKTTSGVPPIACGTSLAPPGKLPSSLTAVFSSMVLSQLAFPLTELLERRFAQRFPESKLLSERVFQVALGQLSHRLQHAHLQALLSQAALATITTDVNEQYTLSGPRGEKISEPLPLIGAPHLEDLLPRATSRIRASEAWRWQRLVPSATRAHGRRLTVNGCVASAR